MKREILFFVLIFLSMTASAQGTVNIDGICYKLNSGDKTAEVVYQRRHEYSGEVVIPSSVTYNDVDYSVTSIGYQAFARSTDLTSVSIPATVTSIGSNIFFECTSLASIVIEEGNAVFDSRENSNAIIETASSKLLFGCMGTTIPDGVASIEASAFSGCTGLTFAIIPNSVTSIGNAAFSGCTSLASINIPNSVTYLGKDAFEGCSSLVKVEINNNAIVSKDYNTNPFIKEIFGSQVEEYILGEDVTSIGEQAFSDCPNLTKVHLSNGVTSIGAGAFYFCGNLAEINIPASMTSIDQTAFTATRLTKVEINSNALVSKDYDSWSSLAKYFVDVEEFVLGDEVTEIGDYAFAGSVAHSINIPSSVTSIGDFAFFANTRLTSVKIPENVTTIGDCAFKSCGLTDMYCYAEQLPEIGSSIFMDTYHKATLHVPASSVDAYSNAEQWNEFPNIVALTDEEMGVEDVMMQMDGKESAIYDLNGRKVVQPTKGIYIQNGKKYVVR